MIHRHHYSRTIARPLAALVALLLLASAFPATAQYDYYDPYSNSNIDYYPMNPVDVSPSYSSDYSTTDTSSGGTSSGGTGATSGYVAACANTPTPNPQNTRSVEIRDAGGKVYYLSPPKEELTNVRAYPEDTWQIYRVTYGSPGVVTEKTSIGLITVDNNCYPKYGYVTESPSTAPVSATVTSAPASTDTSTSAIPDDVTMVKLDPATGKVFHATTGVIISDARYDVAARAIYYKDTTSTFGKVLTDTTGYVNIKTTSTTNVPPTTSTVVTSPTTVTKPPTGALPVRRTSPVYVSEPDSYSGTLNKPFVLDGSKSQDDGAIKTFRWTQVSGPTARIANPTQVRPTFTPTSPGTYLFELVVTDSSGVSSAAQRIEVRVPAIADLDRDGSTDKTSGGAGGTVPLPTGTQESPGLPPGDPDFDLLRIEFNGDDVAALRKSTGATVEGVIVNASHVSTANGTSTRGWDPEKKEEIVAHPENVRTAEDLKTYSEAVILRDEAIEGITIAEGNIAIDTREKGRLFWLFPVELATKVTVTVDPKGGEERVLVHFPWWHVFVKKEVARSVLQAEITGALSATEPVAATELSGRMHEISRALGLVSNILKTKHDTVKNSIGNVR